MKNYIKKIIIETPQGKDTLEMDISLPKENSNAITLITGRNSIMLPNFHTSKTNFLITPHYDAFGNVSSPFLSELLIG